MKKCTAVLIKFLELIDGICMAALVLILFAQVLLRYVFDIGLVWSEELSKAIFVWIVFISISLQVYSNTYLEFSFLREKIRKNQMLVYAFIRVCILVFFVVIGYYGYVYTVVSKAQIMYALKLSMSYLYMIIPISAALSILFLIVRTIEDVSERRITAK